MIRTEAKRRDVDNGERPPPEVLRAMEKADPDLELLWNNNQWEFYRLKQKGTTPSEDIMAWQMSAPTKGKLITPGIVDWVRRFDTNPMGKNTKGELRKKWQEMTKSINYEIKREREKRAEELSYHTKHASDRFVYRPVSIAVPGPIVGYNTRTGRPIRLVKTCQSPNRLLV